MSSPIHVYSTHRAQRSGGAELATSGAVEPSTREKVSCSSLNSDGHLEIEVDELKKESAYLLKRVTAATVVSTSFPTPREDAESVSAEASRIREERREKRTKRPTIPKGFLFGNNNDTQVGNFPGHICTQRDIYD